MKERYYVVVYLTIDKIWDSFIHEGPLETAEDIDTAAATQGEDAVIINWKRIQ